MKQSQPEESRAARSLNFDALAGPANDAGPLRVPPAVIGVLLLVTVVLACAFYVAAQVVQTP